MSIHNTNAILNEEELRNAVERHHVSDEECMKAKRMLEIVFRKCEVPAEAQQPMLANAEMVYTSEGFDVLAHQISLTGGWAYTSVLGEMSRTFFAMNED